MAEPPEGVAMEPVIINEYLYDRGRGVELRSCRLTVNELYPMLTEAQCSDARMLELYPITQPELDAVKRYITDNLAAVAAENAEIDARIARKIAEQDTPDMRARRWWNRERMLAFRNWLSECQERPELFPEVDGESPRDRRLRQYEAFRQWLEQPSPALAEVG
jgi:hypothetical protein